MQKYDYLFIDADDTLYDFETAEKRALQETFEAFGISHNEVNVNLYHRINKGLWEDLEKGLIDQDGIKIERFKRLLEALNISQNPEAVAQFYMTALGKGTDLLAGAYELVEKLSQSYPICIITNGIEVIQTSRIGKSKLAPFIKHIIISEAVGYSKPDSRIFEHAMKLVGMSDKQRVIMIGDSLTSDIKGGNDFGIDTLWVNLNNKLPSETIKPSYEVKRLEDIPNCL